MYDENLSWSRSTEVALIIKLRPPCCTNEIRFFAGKQFLNVTNVRSVSLTQPGDVSPEYASDCSFIQLNNVKTDSTVFCVPCELADTLVVVVITTGRLTVCRNC